MNVKELKIKEVFYSEEDQNEIIIQLHVQCRSTKPTINSSYFIGDSTGYCLIDFDPQKWNELSEYLQKGNFLTITNPIKSRMRKNGLFIGVNTAIKAGPILKNCLDENVHVKKDADDQRAYNKFWDENEKCEGCHKVLPKSVFYRHVSHTKSCKEAYGESWSQMLKKKRKNYEEQKYKKRRKEFKTKYQQSKSQIASHYQKNREDILKRQKERRQNLKNQKKIMKPKASTSSIEKCTDKQSASTSEKVSTKTPFKQDPRTFDFTKCEACGKSFQFGHLLKHIGHFKNQKCLAIYGKDKYEKMKEASRTKSWKKNKKVEKEQCWQYYKELFDNDGPNELQKSINCGSVKKCKGCKGMFLIKAFFKHVSHSECIHSYEKKEWEDMKLERRQEIQRYCKMRQREETRKKRSPESDHHSKLDQENSDSAMSDDSSISQVMKPNEEYIRKRKPVKITMDELDEMAEDEKYEDYDPRK